MASERQIAANGKNAQKSTGPKTPEGRAAVRLNGVKHGLTAGTLVLPGEKESDFESLLADFESEHQPASPTEEALVRQMAMAQWRLRRLYHVEAAFFNLRLMDLEEEIEEDYNNLEPADKLAMVVKQDSGQSSVRENLSRIEGRLERSFYKALRELQRLRPTRPQKTENQSQFPEPGPDPEPKLFLVNPVDAKDDPANSGTPAGDSPGYSLQVMRAQRRDDQCHRERLRLHGRRRRFCGYRDRFYRGFKQFGSTV
jgi:hypothetical protein